MSPSAAQPVRNSNRGRPPSIWRRKSVRAAGSFLTGTLAGAGVYLGHIHHYANFLESFIIDQYSVAFNYVLTIATSLAAGFLPAAILTFVGTSLLARKGGDYVAPSRKENKELIKNRKIISEIEFQVGGDRNISLYDRVELLITERNDLEKNAQVLESEKADRTRQLNNKFRQLSSLFPLLPSGHPLSSKSEEGTLFARAELHLKNLEQRILDLKNKPVDNTQLEQYRSELEKINAIVEQVAGFSPPLEPSHPLAGKPLNETLAVRIDEHIEHLGNTIVRIKKDKKGLLEEIRQANLKIGEIADRLGCSRNDVLAAIKNLQEAQQRRSEEVKVEDSEEVTREAGTEEELTDVKLRSEELEEVPPEIPPDVAAEERYEPLSTQDIELVLDDKEPIRFTGKSSGRPTGRIKTAQLAPETTVPYPAGAAGEIITEEKKLHAVVASSEDYNEIMKAALKLLIVHKDKNKEELEEALIKAMEYYVNESSPDKCLQEEINRLRTTIVWFSGSSSSGPDAARIRILLNVSEKFLFNPQIENLRKELTGANERSRRYMEENTELQRQQAELQARFNDLTRTAEVYRQQASDPAVSFISSLSEIPEGLRMSKLWELIRIAAIEEEKPGELQDIIENEPEVLDEFIASYQPQFKRVTSADQTEVSGEIDTDKKK